MKEQAVETKIELEDKISRAIMSENGCTAHFEYYENTKRLQDHRYSVEVVTYNPNTKEKFLLKGDSSDSYENSLSKVFEYVKNHKVDYDSFTIIWAKRGSDFLKQEKSYFYCKDSMEALEKFFFNKKREDYIIYELKMSAKS